MRAWGLVLLLGIGMPACGGDAGSRPTSGASPSPVCQARPDTTSSGCFATPSSMICSPTGCQSLCAGGQTPVTCTGSGQTAPIPAPDASAGCTVVAIPTPSNELFYCCPCGAS
jgi:hypothetical protein